LHKSSRSTGRQVAHYPNRKPIKRENFRGLAVVQVTIPDRKVGRPALAVFCWAGVPNLRQAVPLPADSKPPLLWMRSETMCLRKPSKLLANAGRRHSAGQSSLSYQGGANSSAVSRSYCPKSLLSRHDATGDGAIFNRLGKKLKNCLERAFVDLLNRFSVVDNRVTQIGRASNARSTWRVVSEG